MIFGTYDTNAEPSPSYANQEGSIGLAGLNAAYMRQAAENEKAKLSLDRINSINLPGVNPMQGIPAQYTRQQGGQQLGGLQPMNMYQNRNQYQNKMGDSMQPMQMLNQYRQTGQAPGMSAGSTPAGGK